LAPDPLLKSKVGKTSGVPQLAIVDYSFMQLLWPRLHPRPRHNKIVLFEENFKDK